MKEKLDSYSLRSIELSTLNHIIMDDNIKEKLQYWKSTIDIPSGDTYYYNSLTRQSCWDPPFGISAQTFNRYTDKSYSDYNHGIDNDSDHYFTYRDMKSQNHSDNEEIGCDNINELELCNKKENEQLSVNSHDAFNSYSGHVDEYAKTSMNSDSFGDYLYSKLDELQTTKNSKDNTPTTTEDEGERKNAEIEVVRSKLILLKKRIQNSKGTNQRISGEIHSRNPVEDETTSTLILQKNYSETSPIICTRKSGCSCNKCRDMIQIQFDSLEVSNNTRKSSSKPTYVPLKKTQSKSNMRSKDFNSHKSPKTTEWRKKSTELRQAISGKKQPQQPVKKSLSPTSFNKNLLHGPNTESRGTHVDLVVQCPTCLHMFNQKVADRHVSRCKVMKTKPTMLLRGSGKHAYNKPKLVEATNAANTPAVLPSPSSRFSLEHRISPK